MKTKVNKYRYIKVIQQHYGQGWEDVSEYECNGSFITKEYSDKLDAKGRRVKLIVLDLREYQFMGYPTRVIKRKELNAG